MDLVYGLPLIAVLAVVWMAVRHAANRARRQRELLRRQRRLSSRARAASGPDTVSARSAMRSADSPITVIDTMQRRASRPSERIAPKELQTKR